MFYGKKINIRPMKMSDWSATVVWRNNISIKKMAMMHPFPITDIVEKEWFESALKTKNDKTLYFTITKKDDYPIGFISLKSINYINNNCQLGIVIGNEEDQGKGYGKEALNTIIGYVFYTLNLNKITMEVVENNTIALVFYKKIGFIEEGRLKQQFFSDGKYLDVLIISIFR